MKISIRDIQTLINGKSEIVGNLSAVFSGIQSVQDAERSDLIWIKPSIKETENIINSTKAGGIICDHVAYKLFRGNINDKLFIITDDPKSVYVAVVKFINDKIFPHKSATIHPTAIIDPACVLGKNVSIGAYSIIGACTIGDDSIIHEHVKIYDRVTIGKKCMIREFCSIGGAGFGYLRNSENQNEHIPHIGTVLIGDRVEIYPFSNVDRGTIGKTQIKEGTVIDHYCHIGHNTSVGRNNIITAGTVLAGGAKIEDNCFIGVNTILKEKCVIGSNVMTGMGSVVVKDIPDNEVWVGNPAKFLRSNLK
jgi:UDP-3-O-[3-hydroxymyristoyl] glucosamine N-acyltransferase LpxD